MDDSHFPSREELGLPPVLEELTSEGGLVVVAGERPGMGVTTTLYSMLDWVNQTRRTHLMTFEDPPERELYHKLSMVSQRQQDLDYDRLSVALRQSCRQGAQVLMVGRLEGKEEMLAAAQAAARGQTVLVGMQSGGAGQVIEEFYRGLGQTHWLTFCLSLSAVCYQALMPTRSGERTPVVEVLRNSPSVQNLLLEQKWPQLELCMETGMNRGMQTWEQALCLAVLEGRLEPEEALEKARDRERLEALLAGPGS